MINILKNNWVNALIESLVMGKQFRIPNSLWDILSSYLTVGEKSCYIDILSRKTKNMFKHLLIFELLHCKYEYWQILAVLGQVFVLFTPAVDFYDHFSWNH